MTRPLLFLIVLLFLFSCSKKNDAALTPIPKKVASVALKAIPVNTFWIGESDGISLEVELKDDKGVLITNYSGKISYFANGTALTRNTLNPTTEGTYDIKAQVENISSTNAIILTAKSPQKELDKIVMTSGFYQKYAVWHTMTGTKPELSVKGYDKNGIEIPIQKGLKAVIGSNEIALNSLTFDKAGTQKIVGSAYGKQAEMTFTVRSPRTFEVVKLPIVFHFCQPGPYRFPNSKETDETMFNKALEALKNEDYIKLLNQTFRNQYETDISQHDPNAQDTFIEFYLAETDPNGKPLAQKGVDLLNFTKPYQSGSTYDYSTPEAKLYFQNVQDVYRKWNPNQYLNVIVEPAADNYGYGGAAGGGGLDISRKSLVPAEFFDLPILNYTAVPSYSSFFTNANSPGISLNGYVHFFWAGATSGTRIVATLTHELGHILGLPHTFGQSSNCTDKIHSDGMLDTPTCADRNASNNCEGGAFTQKNTMSYLSNGIKTYFTYDQVTVMRARIEAGFNLPTPRNKGKSGGRIGEEDNGRYFGQTHIVTCNGLH